MTRRYNLIKKAYDSIPDHLRYRIEFEAVAENPLTEIRQLAHWLGVTEGKAVVTAAESIREDFIHF